jgi:single-stranded-DNA-specific exonuclease
MTEDAKRIAADQVADGRQSLVVYLPDGHPGVQGIVASRLVEAFGRPAFVLAPKENDPELYVGSGRSVEGLDIRDTVQAVVDQHPEFLKYFGGHKAAMGKTGYLEHLEAYSQALEVEVRKRMGDHSLHPVVWTDGELSAQDISMELASSITNLEPFGRGFERPVFSGEMILTGLKPMGDGTHYKLNLQKDGRVFEAVWFRAVSPGQKLKLPLGSPLELAFEVGINTFRGVSRLQLIVRA